MRRQKTISEPEKISEPFCQPVVVKLDGLKHGRVFQLMLFSLAVVCLLLNQDAAFAGDVKGRVNVAGGMDNANVVVYVEKVDSTFAPPGTPAIMDQKHLQFIPEVLPVVAGTTVKFLNSDEVLHNVFTPSSCAGGFNLGSFPPGESKAHTFDKPGCNALILCDVHPEMQAWVVVLQNPYFAVSDSSGSYIIKGIPAGTYTLRAWFGYYKTETAKVVVPDDGSVTIDFEIKQ